MEFAVTSEDHPAATVVAVAGELDIATAPELTDVVDAVLEPGPPALVVDLTATTFADSSGCRALVQAAKACRRAGRGLEIVCPEGNTAVRRVLDLVGMTAVAPVRERRDDTAAGGTAASAAVATPAVPPADDSADPVGRAERPA